VKFCWRGTVLGSRLWMMLVVVLVRLLGAEKGEKRGSTMR